jgi:fructose-bisphosphate aldolase class II
MADFAGDVAGNHPVLIALHTDHCPPTRVDDFLRPLLLESLERARRREPPVYQSHMFDGSSLPLDQNLDTAAELLEMCREANVVLEIEIGVVGGEEDGLDGRGVDEERLYSKPEDAIAVVERLGTGGHGRYLLAATFGNIHGVYTSLNAKLRPEILGELRDVAVKRFGADAGFDFVFHGGSGSTRDQIQTAIEYGVVKFNLDTDLQYAYTRAVADHIFRNYDGVLPDRRRPWRQGGVRPTSPGAVRPRRQWRARVAEACEVLRSSGRTIASRLTHS